MDSGPKQLLVDAPRQDGAAEEKAPWDASRADGVANDLQRAQAEQRQAEREGKTDAGRVTEALKAGGENPVDEVESVDGSVESDVSVQGVKKFGNNPYVMLHQDIKTEAGVAVVVEAMPIPGLGCVVADAYVSKGNFAMKAEVTRSLVFVPGVKIKEEKDEAGNVVSRKLVRD